MERFTIRARRVLSLAHQEAERARNNNIGTEHLLLGLMDEEGGVAGRVLRELGMTSDRVREVIRRGFDLVQRLREPMEVPGECIRHRLSLVMEVQTRQIAPAGVPAHLDQARTELEAEQHPSQQQQHGEWSGGSGRT